MAYNRFRRPIRAGITIVLLITGAGAFADTEHGWTLSYDSVRDKLITLPEGSAKKASDVEFYHALFDPTKLEAGQPIRFRIAFGFMDLDGRPVTEDPADSAGLIDHLKEGCPPAPIKYETCGFTESRRTPLSVVLTKSVSRGSGPPALIEVEVSHASLDPPAMPIKTVAAAQARQDAQKSLSTQARQSFLDSFGQVDAVLYIGHARDGGGPDFSPPRLNSLKEPDYKWYHAHPAGLADLVDAIGKADPKPKFLSLDACLTDSHFKTAIRKAAAGAPMALMSTTDVASFDETSAASLISLNGLLRQESFDQIKHELNTVASPTPEFNIEGGQAPTIPGAPAKRPSIQGAAPPPSTPLAHPSE